jgi:hypothetical protein
VEGFLCWLWHAPSCFASAAHHVGGMPATQLHEHDSLDDRDAEIARLKAEIEYLRPFAPPRPPDGWVSVKHAAVLAHRSEQLIYKRRRLGKLESTKVRSRVWVNPRSLQIV